MVLSSAPHATLGWSSAGSPGGDRTGRGRLGSGHDLNYLGLTGTLSAIGRTGERPVPPLNLVADFGGGSMLLVVGVMAALWERQSSGRGQTVDAAMVDGTALLSQMMWSFRNQGLWGDTRGTNPLDGGAPYYDTYPCKDGRFVAVGAIEPQFFAALCTGLGIDGAGLPGYFDPTGWPQWRTLIGDALLTRTRDEWTEAFDGVDACLTPVVELSETLTEPHLAARGTFTVVDGVQQAAPAPRFSRTPAAEPVAPRPAGGDLDAVRSAWGLPG